MSTTDYTIYNSALGIPIDTSGPRVYQGLCCFSWKYDSNGGYNIIKKMAKQKGWELYGTNSKSLSQAQAEIKDLQEHQKRWFKGNNNMPYINEEYGVELMGTTDLLRALIKKKLFVVEEAQEFASRPHSLKLQLEEPFGTSVIIENQDYSSLLVSTFNTTQSTALYPPAQQPTEQAADYTSFLKQQNVYTNQTSNTSGQTTSHSEIDRTPDELDNSEEVFDNHQPTEFTTPLQPKQKRRRSVYETVQATSTPINPPPQQSAAKQARTDTSNEMQEMSNQLNRAIRDKKCSEHCAGAEIAQDALHEFLDGKLLIDEDHYHDLVRRLRAAETALDELYATALAHAGEQSVPTGDNSV